MNGLLPGKGRGGTTGHGHAPVPNAHGGRRSNEPSVWIDGIAVIDRNALEVRRRVGLVFQDPDDQLFCNTVIDDVAFGPLNQGKSAAEARTIALRCLTQVDLEEAAERPPHHLSFGERKRVCLAGVLACDPSVLVLDEPSANLDPRSRRRFIQILESLSCTKLVATHDLELVLEVCRRTVLLDAGLVIAEGASRDILGDSALTEAHGLEQPLSLKYAFRSARMIGRARLADRAASCCPGESQSGRHGACTRAIRCPPPLGPTVHRRSILRFPHQNFPEPGRIMKRPQVGIGRRFGGRIAGLDRAEEKVHGVRPQPRVSGLPRQDRDGACRVVQPVRRGTLDQAVDVVQGAALAEPRANQGAKLNRVDQVGVSVRRTIEMLECRWQVGAPHDEGHAVMGLGVVRVLLEHRVKSSVAP